MAKIRNLIQVDGRKSLCPKLQIVIQTKQCYYNIKRLLDKIRFLYICTSSLKCRSWTAGRVSLQGFWQGFFRGGLAPRKMKGWMERRVFLRDAMHHKYWPQPPETSSILPTKLSMEIVMEIPISNKSAYGSDIPPWNTDSIYPEETLKSAFYLN